jgi:hypothetical protein
VLQRQVLENGKQPKPKGGPTMMDGRFDQHFLEVFATSQDQSDQSVQWLLIVFSLLVTTVFGFGALLMA